MPRNWWSLVCALMLDRARGALVHFLALPVAAHLRSASAAPHVQAKYAAGRAKKNQGKV